VGGEDRQGERRREEQRCVWDSGSALRHQYQQGSPTHVRRSEPNQRSLLAHVAPIAGCFGLRREESIKIQPAWADRGDRLVLKDSWTKGGRAREIPIRNAQQRLVLDEAKRVAAKGSLIPSDATYVQQLRRFEYQCDHAGIDRVHGHRHQYAQDRYRELTGWPSPASGGPRSRELTPEQKAIDREARLTISRELGHEREQVTSVYCGR
jgi:hypothetical protein